MCQQCGSEAGVARTTSEVGGKGQGSGPEAGLAQICLKSLDFLLFNYHVWWHSCFYRYCCY